LLFDPPNEVQMPYNLLYWKEDFFKLRRVVFAVDYSLSIKSQKLNKTELRNWPETNHKHKLPF